MQRRKGWWEDAACQSAGTHIFFPTIQRGDCKSRITALFAEAKEYCDRCDVRIECLQAQIKVERETYCFDGMWGGMTPYERKAYVSDLEWQEKTKAR